MKRNPGIELYRILLTFGICLLHAMTTCGHRMPGFGGRISYFLYSCVVGFVFITGWYGIKFCFFKLAKLWGVALYAAAVVAVIDIILHGYSGVLRYCDILRGNWFLNGYTVLMLVAPSVNIIIEDAVGGCGARRSAARSAIVLLLVLVFGWAFLRTCPFVSRFLPVSAGVEAYSGLALIGIYTGARLVRVFNVADSLSAGARFVVAMVCLVAIACHLSTYVSPFALGLAMLGFFVFKNLRLGLRTSRLVVAIAPSMFAVFLLHANPIGFGLMSLSLDRDFMGGWLSFPLTALIAFVVAIVFDFPRRFTLYVLMRLAEVKYAHNDSDYERN